MPARKSGLKLCAATGCAIASARISIGSILDLLPIDEERLLSKEIVLSELKNLASEGNADAQWLMHQAYDIFLFDLGKKDRDAMKLWLDRAVESKQPDALVDVARHWLTEQKNPELVKKFVSYMTLAAEQGNTLAMRFLGRDPGSRRVQLRHPTDDDHAAGVHAHRDEPRLRSDLVSGADADQHRNGANDAALWYPAICDEGRRVAGHDHGRYHPFRNSVSDLRSHRHGSDHRVPRNHAGFAKFDGKIAPCP